jgi:hypothetical protein
MEHQQYGDPESCVQVDAAEPRRAATGSAAVSSIAAESQCDVVDALLLYVSVSSAISYPCSRSTSVPPSSSLRDPPCVTGT